MRKHRLFYYLFTIITTILICCYSIYYQDYLTGFLTIAFLVSVNFILKRKEKIKVSNMMLKYTIECDPITYISNMKKYAKSCYLTKKQKLIYELYYASAYIDSGEFEKAKETLLLLDKKEHLLDELVTVLYLKAWSDYFYFNMYDEKMKETLLKLKDIIIDSKNSCFTKQYKAIYLNQEAKYYILVNENLKKAQEVFLERAKLPYLLSSLHGCYNLALIALREGRYNEGVAMLNKISESNKNLFVVRKSKQLLSLI